MSVAADGATHGAFQPLADREAFERTLRQSGLAAYLVAGPGSSALVAAAEGVRSRFPGVRWFLLEDAGLAGMLGVEAGPGLVLFRDGIGLFADRFTSGEAPLEALLRRAQGLDMAQVRREMEQARAAEAALATRRVCPTARRGPMPG